MARNSNLAAAKRAKNDEFYTTLDAVQNELCYYSDHFTGATILCNCDDYLESNFFVYFAINFRELGLKRLIGVSYEGSPYAGKYIDNPKWPYIATMEEPLRDFDGNGGIDKRDLLLAADAGIVKLKKLDSAPDNMLRGDFRSPECLALLDEADIVSTNPPFSLFREYVHILMEHEKKFVIVGNKNAITYKEVFPLIKDNRLWLGYTSPKEFITQDGNLTKQQNGLTRWYTNLDIKKRHEELILYRKYVPEFYPKYDNYDAIEVGRVTNIPCDYDGVMGVPITFLDKYNPEQFRIIGLLQSSSDELAGIPNLRYYNDFKEMRQDMALTGATGKKANGNPVLKGKSIKGNFLYNDSTDEYVHSAYARITVKKVV